MKKSQKQHLDIKLANCPGIEFDFACDVIKSVEFGKIYGSYDVTGNFELDFRAISWLQALLLTFLRHFWAFSNCYLDKKLVQCPIIRGLKSILLELWLLH